MARLVDRTSGLMDRAGALLRRYARPVRDALILVGLARAAYYFFVQDIRPWTFVGLDARAYWGVDLAHPYVNSGLGEVSTYLYSPAFAQLMAPLSNLPFEVFLAGWMILLAAVFVWLVWPWPWAALILFLPVTYELFVGNVHFLIAAAIVVGFRAPAAWAFPVLTKITPAVGLLWFPVRRDWRGLAIAVGNDRRHRAGVLRHRAVGLGGLGSVPPWLPRTERAPGAAGCPRRGCSCWWSSHRQTMARAGGRVHLPARRLDQLMGHPARRHPPARRGPADHGRRGWYQHR